MAIIEIIKRFARKASIFLLALPMIPPTAFAFAGVPLQDADCPATFCDAGDQGRRKKKKIQIRKSAPNPGIMAFVGGAVSLGRGRAPVLLRDDSPNLVHVLHTYSLDPSKSLVAEDLAHAIQQAGGEVAILDGRGDIKRNGVPRFEVDPSVTRWVQNYLGFWARTCDTPNGYTLFNYDLYQSKRSNDAEIPHVLSEALSVPVKRLNLKMQGGSLIPVDDTTAIVSRKLLHDNPALSLDQCRRELAKMGIEKVIWTPWLAGEGSGHADLYAAAFDGKVIVSRILPEAVRFSANPPVAKAAQESLDRVADLLESQRLHVLRLAMPVPGNPNSRNILPYYSPVNWIAVRPPAEQRASTLIIPVPAHDISDAPLLPQYEAMNSRVFAELNVSTRFIKTTLPEWGGAFRCVSGCLPRDLITKTLATNS